jgi:hypothetical protein
MFAARRAQCSADMQSFVTRIDIDQILKKRSCLRRVLLFTQSPLVYAGLRHGLEKSMQNGCTRDKSEPIDFDCPGCGAKYNIVTTDVANSGSKFGCLKCDALFPAGRGRVSLEYILLDSDADE